MKTSLSNRLPGGPSRTATTILMSVDLYIVRVDGTGLRKVTDTPMGQWEEAADWTAAAP